MTPPNPNHRLTPTKGREQRAALKRGAACCRAGCTEQPIYMILRGAARYPACEDDAAGEVLACLELGGTFTVVPL